MLMLLMICEAALYVFLSYMHQLQSTMITVHRTQISKRNIAILC